MRRALTKALSLCLLFGAANAESAGGGRIIPDADGRIRVLESGAAGEREALSISRNARDLAFSATVVDRATGEVSRTKYDSDARAVERVVWRMGASAAGDAGAGAAASVASILRKTTWTYDDAGSTSVTDDYEAGTERVTRFNERGLPVREDVYSRAGKAATGAAGAPGSAPANAQSARGDAAAAPGIAAASGAADGGAAGPDRVLISTRIIEYDAEDRVTSEETRTFAPDPGGASAAPSAGSAAGMRGSAGAPAGAFGAQKVVYEYAAPGMPCRADGVRVALYYESAGGDFVLRRRVEYDTDDTFTESVFFGEGKTAACVVTRTERGRRGRSVMRREEAAR